MKQWFFLARTVNLLSGVLQLFFYASGGAFAQQDYAGNVTGCSTGGTTSASVRVGYTCSEALPACQARAYYRTRPAQSLSDVASLFATSTSDLAAANLLPSTASLASNQPLLIPLSCNCSSLSYSSAEVPYTVQQYDTMYSLENSTYQGLTTCCAINASNPSATAMDPGSRLTIPLRCACPSKAQISVGINFLITYSIVSGDNLDTVGLAFGANAALFQAANNLSQDSAIYPQTTVLIPLAKMPNQAPSVGFSAPSTTPSSSSDGHKSLPVGGYVAIGVLVALVALATLAFCIYRKCSHRSASQYELMQKLELQLRVEDDRNGIKLVTYSTVEIAAATRNFDTSNCIEGSVYRGELRHQDVAIKRIDWNSKEIDLLEKLHHLQIVPLWGYCRDRLADSFLVFPLIGQGSLKDWLHKFPCSGSSPCHLDWAARVRIARDIANALVYLHNDETKPRILHRNITSSNVLVNGKFRGKLSNFSMAKSTEDMEHGQMQASRVDGTRGYLAPEYIGEGLLSLKTDVFAFGVLLLEMLSGKPAHVSGEEEGSQLPGNNGLLWESASTIGQGNLRRWMDPKLNGQYPIDHAMKMLSLAKRCVAHDPSSRANMAHTYADLQDLMDASENWEHNEMLER